MRWGSVGLAGRLEGTFVMRIGFIPGPLDTLSGEHFPHLVHMQENLAALRKRLEVSVLTPCKANARYLRFQRSITYKTLNRKQFHIIRKFVHLMFFLLVYLEQRKNIDNDQGNLFLARFSFSNFLVIRYLRSRGHKILLEVHALAHIEEKQFGQTHIPFFFTHFYFIIVTWLEKRILGWADEITVVSTPLKDSLIRLGIDGRKIHVIHNAIDTDKFNCIADAMTVVKQYKLDNKTVIGFVGSFARYHGFDILLDVAEGLQEKYRNIHFFLIGKNVHGSDDPEKEVRGRGLSELFTFSGEIPHSEIPVHVAAMDITIIPDFNNYGSPMKLFEYMAMKKAVVAPNVAPIREIVEDGRTGILFEKGNVADSIRCIEKLLEDEELRTELGQRAHSRVLSCHTWDRNAERIAEIAGMMLGR